MLFWVNRVIAWLYIGVTVLAIVWAPSNITKEVKRSGDPVSVAGGILAVLSDFWIIWFVYTHM